MKRPLVLLAAASLAATAAGAQTPQSPTPPAGFPTRPPAAGPVRALTPPQPETRTLRNGLRVQYVRQAELPVVYATLVSRGGIGDEPLDVPGLASFTASMLDEGAAGRTSLQIADALDQIGASLSSGAGFDAAQTSLYVLRKNFAQGLGIMADVLLRPDFPEAEVQRLRQERMTTLARAADQPGIIAANAYQLLVFGARHPYGRPATREATERLTRDALAAFHRRFIRPDGATLVLVGDVDPATMHPQIEQALGGWRGEGSVSAYAVPAPARPGATTVYLVDKPGAAQSEIRIGHPGVARSNPDYFPLVVMNTMLGGYFGSRLNLNLREKHAYTYGAGSGYSMRRGVGPFTAQAAVVTAKTDSALVQFFHEMERMRAEPVPADEVARAKSYLALSLPGSLETAPDVAVRLADQATLGVGPDFYSTYVQRVMAVTPADVRRVANTYLSPDRAVVVVVGDRSKVEAGLKTLRWPVQLREASEFTR